MGIVDHLWLARRRRTALLLAFVVGAVLTPPDIVSQLAIAGPFVVLYEVSIVVARVGAKRSRDAFSEENRAE